MHVLKGVCLLLVLGCVQVVLSSQTYVTRDRRRSVHQTTTTGQQPSTSTGSTSTPQTSSGSTTTPQTSGGGSTSNPSSVFPQLPDISSFMSTFQAYMSYMDKFRNYAPEGQINELYAPRNSSTLVPFLQADDVHRGGYDDLTKVPSNSCTRQCVKGQNKVCYYQFTFETYPTLGAACTDCLTNITSCFARGCVTADGVERTILTNNRMLPSPSIQVCEGDTVVVDVKNKMLGKSTTIHWHGLRQILTPYSDGVPMVTQCPINECQVFRYTMLADVAGTLFYHPHDGLEKVDGITGAFVIRQPKSDDPNGALYDFDLPSHVIVVNDWFHDLADTIFPGMRFNNTEQVPKSYLINGRGIYFDNGVRFSNVPISIFHVTQGNRYVFRIVAATCFECQYEFTIEGHDMTIIGTDAQSSQPVKVNALVMSPGERYTVIVNANQAIKSYWIHVRAIGLCAHTRSRQVAILHYDGSPNQPTTPIPRFNVSANPSTQTFAVSPINSKCDQNVTEGICLKNLQAVNSAPAAITAPVPQFQTMWAFGFHFYTNDSLFNNNLYPTFLQSPAPVVGSTINGIINALPPSPLLTQYSDAAPFVCNPSVTPISQWSAYRECANVIKVPLMSAVEVLIVDTATYSPTGISHAIHLHGYDYYVIDQGVFPDGLQFNDSIAWLQNKLANRKVGDIPQFPVRKDTVPLTSGGYVIVRIWTDNPGFWFFHCHFAYHLDSGMGGVLQVGEVPDMVPAPPDFPRCGDYLPYIEIS